MNWELYKKRWAEMESRKRAEERRETICDWIGAFFLMLFGIEIVLFLGLLGA